MMDMLKLKFGTKIMRNMLAKLISKAIYHKIGCEVNLAINEIEIVMEDGIARIHTSLDANVNKDDLTRIIQSF